MSHHLVSLFDALLTTFDLVTLLRMAENPLSCQSIIAEELNPYEFYADYEPGIRELVERQAGLLGLAPDELSTALEGHPHKSLALWAIHQAARELIRSEDAAVIEELFQGHIPAGMHLVPIRA